MNSKMLPKIPGQNVAQDNGWTNDPVDVDQAFEGNEEEPNSQNWITTEEYDEDNTEAPPRVSDLVQQKESEQELVTQQKQENEEEEAFVSAAGNFLC